jgi:DNA-binding MurR/RpiR family transcriptional regulator
MTRQENIKRVTAQKVLSTQKKIAGYILNMQREKREITVYTLSKYSSMSYSTIKKYSHLIDIANNYDRKYKQATFLDFSDIR